ncbi:unnamed protein product [Amoebophrya sp. A25]|nr:unnamed protein product [Amoebophrya sp. A25]|eukprot:GSA25T00023674001.1
MVRVSWGRCLNSTALWRALYASPEGPVWLSIDHFLATRFSKLEHVPVRSEGMTFTSFHFCEFELLNLCISVCT